MSFVFELLAKPFAGKIMGALSLVLILMVGLQTWRLHSTQTNLAKARASVTVLTAANVSNVATIKTLKDANDEFARTQRARDDAAKAAVDGALADAAILRRERDRARTDLELQLHGTPEGDHWSDTDLAAVLPDLAAHLRMRDCQARRDSDCRSQGAGDSGTPR